MRIGVTGHQNLPSGTGTFVREAVVSRWSKDRSLVVISSLAAGADQLLAGLAVELGGHIEVVLPCIGYEATLDEGDGRATYERLLAAAVDVEHLSFHAPGEDAFMAAGRRVVDRCDRLLAVWDGLPARGHGGTADVVAYATAGHVPVDVVWPPGVRRDTAP